MLGAALAAEDAGAATGAAAPKVAAGAVAVEPVVCPKLNAGGADVVVGGWNIDGAAGVDPKLKSDGAGAAVAVDAAGSKESLLVSGCSSPPLVEGALKLKDAEGSVVAFGVLVNAPKRPAGGAATSTGASALAPNERLVVAAAPAAGSDFLPKMSRTLPDFSSDAALNGSLDVVDELTLKMEPVFDVVSVVDAAANPPKRAGAAGDADLAPNDRLRAGVDGAVVTGVSRSWLSEGSVFLATAVAPNWNPPVGSLETVASLAVVVEVVVTAEADPNMNPPVGASTFFSVAAGAAGSTEAPNLNGASTAFLAGGSDGVAAPNFIVVVTAEADPNTNPPVGASTFFSAAAGAAGSIEAPNLNGASTAFLAGDSDGVAAPNLKPPAAGAASVLASAMEEPNLNPVTGSLAEASVLPNWKPD